MLSSAAMARRDDLLKDPDRMAIRRFGGIGTLLFGLVFAIVGGGILVATISQGETHPAPILTGLAFMVAGMGFGFSRSEVILDRRQRVAVSWWGLLRPMRLKSRSLEDVERVEIGREIRTSSSNNGTRRYVVYPIRLDGPSAKRLPLGETQDLLDARRRGEEIAKFLSLPLHDGSDGEGVRVREPGALDESLADRLKREGNLALPGPPPEGSGLRVEERPGRLVVRVPLPVSIGQSVFLLVFAAAPTLFFWQMRGQFEEAGGGDAFPIRLFMIFFLVIWWSGSLLPLLHGLTRRERLLVTRGRLIQERRWLLGKRTTEIPLGEIEELSLTRSAGNLGRKRVLSAVSDAALIQVGGKLDEPALEWLRRRLSAAIAAA
jgi:hypothetical protein